MGGNTSKKWMRNAFPPMKKSIFDIHGEICKTRNA
jgi:hypothetical protein